MHGNSALGLLCSKHATPHINIYCTAPKNHVSTAKHTPDPTTLKAVSHATSAPTVAHYTRGRTPAFNTVARGHVRPQPTAVPCFSVSSLQGMGGAELLLTGSLPPRVTYSARGPAPLVGRTCMGHSTAQHTAWHGQWHSRGTALLQHAHVAAGDSVAHESSTQQRSQLLWQFVHLAATSMCSPDVRTHHNLLDFVSFHLDLLHLCVDYEHTHA